MLGNCLLWTLSVKYLCGVSLIHNSYTQTVEGTVDPTWRAIAYIYGGADASSSMRGCDLVMPAKGAKHMGRKIKGSP